MTRADDDGEDWGVCLGFGSVSTLTQYEPTREELEQIKQRRPIGFVHFGPKPTQPKRRQSAKRG